MVNARFYDWINGAWVKLTLEPGQRLQHVKGGPTDEGYSWTRHTWKHDGLQINWTSETRASDCDGPIEWFDQFTAQLDQLAACECYHEPNEPAHDHKRPLWVNVESSQRDHNAEAAGY